MAEATNNLPSTESLLSGIKDGSISLSNSIQDPVEQDTRDSEESQGSSSDFNIDEYLNLGTDSSVESNNQSKDSSSKPQTDGTKPSAHITEVLVGPKGQQRKVSIDLADTDRVKEYVRKAHDFQNGMRKFQQERDQLSKSVEQHEKDWKLLDELWERGGARALITKLSNNDSSAFDRIIDEAIAERQRLEDMTPEEKAEMRATKTREEAAKREKELQQSYEDRLNKLQEQQQNLLIREVQAKAVNALDRYGFDGQLGSPDAEHLWNEALWSKALANLKNLPDNMEPTQELIDREFRVLATKLKQTMNVQVKKNTQAAVASAKKTAMDKIHVQSSKGTVNQEADKFKQDIKSGNIAGALKSFLTGSVKL